MTVHPGRCICDAASDSRSIPWAIRSSSRWAKPKKTEGAGSPIGWLLAARGRELDAETVRLMKQYCPHHKVGD